MLPNSIAPPRYETMATCGGKYGFLYFPIRKLGDVAGGAIGFG
jgi:hypothetical protein